MLRSSSPPAYPPLVSVARSRSARSEPTGRPNPTEGCDPVDGSEWLAERFEENRTRLQDASVPSGRPEPRSKRGRRSEGRVSLGPPSQAGENSLAATRITAKAVLKLKAPSRAPYVSHIRHSANQSERRSARYDRLERVNVA